MEQLHRMLDRWRAGLAALALAVCVALVIACLALLTLDVTLRYVFNHNIQHVAELVTIAFLYVFMLGAAALYARNEDIALDVLFARVPPRLQAAWLFLVHVAIIATMLTVCVQTDVIVGLQKTIRTPSLRLPIAVEYAALFAAAVVIAFSSFVDALGSLLWLSTGRRPPHLAPATHA